MLGGRGCQPGVGLGDSGTGRDDPRIAAVVQREDAVHRCDRLMELTVRQLKVAQRNLQVTRETLDLTRQRFDAGVTDNVEVVQAQESLTSAELDGINSVFAHNVAKLSLARAIASAADNLQQFLTLQ